MAHFAEIDSTNTVLRVIVVADEHEANGAEWCHNLLGGTWVQTSYNTYAGVHVNGGAPLRRNYAGVGMIYDSVRDAFYWPQPTDSGTWVLDEFSCTWRRPVPLPETVGAWCWNETLQEWFITDNPLLVGKWIE